VDAHKSIVDAGFFRIFPVVTSRMAVDVPKSLWSLALRRGNGTMNGTMGAKKPPTDRHKQPRLTLRLPQEAGAVLRRIARKNHRTMTAEVLLALEKHAEENGEDWPELSPEDT
jgi:hypothetical protein